ncbi:MAG: aminopeptidase P family protein [Nitrospinota bacterium]|nr:MAG: aminopeptidase P family protein [Nitrospinota bacterium]
MDYDAHLIIAASERDANLYYATKFSAPDPFIFLQVRGQKLIVVSDLEIERAKAQARVDIILSLSAYEKQLEQEQGERPSLLQVLDAVLQEQHIQKILVPADFRIEAADFLRERGYHVDWKQDPFYEERLRKSAEEVAQIAEVQRAAEAAMQEAETLLRTAEIHEGTLYLHGEPLTAEMVKKQIHITLLEHDCTARHTIVAGGDDACFPHNEGSGPLPADAPVVIDIFPQSNVTGYYADITRTFVRGTPSPRVERMYEAVLAAQTLALERIKEGINGRDIHQAVSDLFVQYGFQSGNIEGTQQGFIHGTGHGVGLEIHEPPRISRTDHLLQAGEVVTVEPGLYYLGAGGVRIEDLVVVTRDGCQNLTRYPKHLVLA